jgi:antitoxin VapB
MMNEFEDKLARIRTLLRQRSLDALLLQQASNFAWATCGASSFVNQAAERGAAALVITQFRQALLTDNIEAPRLDSEEMLEDQGWEFRISPWHQANEAVEEYTRGMIVGADSPRAGLADLSADLIPLRTALTLAETKRFRELGSLCAAAMDAAARQVRPGMTEHELAGLLGRETLSRGAQPTVNLIAADERVLRFRHPLPTEKRLDRYAMLVLCGRKWGLVCSLTRLVHFGPMPDELRRKAEAVAQIDARMIAATRPGRTIGDVFREGVSGYEAAGFAEEWKLHHQGGLAGYAPREIVATPTSDFRVSAGHAYAWNPSITGTKSEDTILVGDEGNEIITKIAGWPTVALAAGAAQVERPAILVQS